MEGNNDDEEPQICTVFSSTPSSTHSKTIFDTIAFSVPKKENSVLSPTSPFSEEEGSLPPPTITKSPVTGGVATSTSGMLFSKSCAAVEPESLQQQPPPASMMFESLSMSYMAPSPTSAPSLAGGESLPITPTAATAVVAATATSSLPYYSANETQQVSGRLSAPLSLPIGGATQHPDDPVIGQGLNEESLRLVSNEIEALSLGGSSNNLAGESVDYEQSPLPTANQLFTNAPEIPFPVGVAPPPPPQTSLISSSSAVVPPPHQLSFVQEQLLMEQQSSSSPGGVNPTDAFSTITYSKKDAAYDAWIPNEKTRQVLMTVATSVNSGTYFPDKVHMTTPGVIYKEDLVDKVAVNMSRIFGEAEASKRQILTADSVTQDDKGIRELVKLGCYRSAINLTKRLLTLYGQGPGKIGQFSKHTPHSIQLWMTRIALLVRIREFKIAESELEAFGDFENPDMYYEYYQDLYGQGRKGSMIPFYFRLMAAEIPQYASKDYNGSTNRLAHILQTIQQILRNINEGISEDGSSVTLDEERRNFSLKLWGKREIRVYYSLTNAFLLAKDFPNVLKYLSILREKDVERKAQLTSAIGRLFLQYGDLPTAQKHFKEAASLRSTETESERVENLVDAALYFIAQGAYSEAFGLLKEALVVQPDNFMITNNMAVCLLYMGKVKESLQIMESTVHGNKPQLLQENVILNLSTIYELENSDGSKKNALLKLISEYKGDGINLASLKMPNLI